MAQNINSGIDVDAVMQSASVERIIWTNYHDIVKVKFNSKCFRPGNLSEYMGDFEISHIDFENQTVEYTEQ